ncbi:NAD(P)H-dependent oxidoreductase [Salinispira pacifica]|uniref:NAD(P)H dehydrogenase, quinone n=1 Tax=Salinispira pacifica TaxID=1307761 RepID=V5WFE5_9SPIO|nr:NAD(P)H-dependent oxidoreductase [Salinispira pacifica]AHC14279.1 NAD(P)H dehydrogenase, quinone [Salinispira pacifica]
MKAETKILSVLAHPDPESYCAALHGEFTRAAEAVSIDLYGDNFDPRMELSELQRHIPIDEPAREYVKQLSSADHLAVFFPDWWGAEPAIFKGWLDRILRPGVAYDRNEGRNPGMSSSSDTHGLLDGMGFTVVITSDSDPARSPETRDIYRQRYIAGIGEFCGFHSAELRFLGPVRTSRLKQRKLWLQDIRQLGLRLSGKAEAGETEAGNTVNRD